MISAIRLLIPPRTFAKSISTSAQSSPVVRERSMESTCPRIRLMRETSFCFSLSISAMFFLAYILWGYDTKNECGDSVSAGDARQQYEHKFRRRTSEYPEIFSVP